MSGAVLLVAAVLGATPWSVGRTAGPLRRGVAPSGSPGASPSGWSGASASGRWGATGGSPRGGAPGRAGVASSPDLASRRALGRWHSAGAARTRSSAWSRRRGAPGGTADPALLLDLVAVALAAGAPVPTALTAVGTAWPGAVGEALVRAGHSLALGAPWDIAWAGAAGARPVADALEPAWIAGASPVPLLRTAADRVRSRRRARARAAAGRLGVQLVVPLGLCFLPAFVLVGLVPVVVSLAAGVLG